MYMIIIVRIKVQKINKIETPNVLSSKMEENSESKNLQFENRIFCYCTVRKLSKV